MNKTFLELASEAAVAMVHKGLIRVPQEKGETWNQLNKKAVKTFGWAVLEIYREIEAVPRRAKEIPKDKSGKKIVVVR
jgi:DNA repair photolyase